LLIDPLFDGRISTLLDLFLFVVTNWMVDINDATVGAPAVHAMRHY
jgi:hypothetical protein